MAEVKFKNPYRPGAGHMPPYLAGREEEFKEFARLLEQDTILENMVLTGLRGVGKTVLLERFKPLAMESGWLWVGADLSESASISEEAIATRLLADLAVATSGFETDIDVEERSPGFSATPTRTSKMSLSHGVLEAVYSQTPGLVLDKLKAVLEFVFNVVDRHGRKRIIFAYDEAQNLSDHAHKDEFPLSLLLDVFQSLQRKNIPFMLILTGLPTLFPKLVEARTFSERMFRVVMLGRLDRKGSEDAILKPIETANCPVRFDEQSVGVVCDQSGGYPYFIQFICREVFDVFIQQTSENEAASVPVDAIQQKLDTDFFSGRWGKATDRQRHLLWVIATLGKDDEEFTIQQIVAQSKHLPGKSFSSSHVNQMLASLSDQGLIYKNRFGKYSFAVPLLAGFIQRTYERSIESVQPS